MTIPKQAVEAATKNILHLRYSKRATDEDIARACVEAATPFLTAAQPLMGVHRPEDVARVGWKYVYVKRWRTLIHIPESIADEVRDALRTGQPDESSVLQDDLRDMLIALGLPDGARPQSPHEVFRECIEAVKQLRAPHTGQPETYTEVCRNEKCPRGGAPVEVVTRPTEADESSRLAQAFYEGLPHTGQPREGWKAVPVEPPQAWLDKWTCEEEGRVEYRRLLSIVDALPARPAKLDHVLYETSDADAPPSIQDRNGEVVLGLCKVCGRAEVELSDPCHPASPPPPVAESGWQPIESAPRNAHPIQVTSVEAGNNWLPMTAYCCGDPTKWERPASRDGLPYMPTHWRPLPAPPHIDEKDSK